MTNVRLAELEELPVDLSDVQFDAAVQKAHALKPAEEINETVNNQPNLEDMILANTNMQSYATADVLYDFDGFALTNEDGTRELKNKALHSDTPNGKLYSGNPLDFQGSQTIDIPRLDLSFWENPFTIIFSVIPSSIASTLFWAGNRDSLIRIQGYNIDFKTYNDGMLDVHSVPITYDERVTIAFRFDGTNMTSFKDGENVLVQEYMLGAMQNTDFSIGGRPNSNGYSDCQMEYFAIVEDALSESEIKRFTTEPEKALTDYGTNPDLKGVFVTDFSGDGKYVSNMCSYALENKLLIGNGFLIPGNETANIIEEDTNTYITEVTEIGTSAARPWAGIDIEENFEPLAEYYIEVTFTSIENDCSVQSCYLGTGTGSVRNIEQTITEGNSLTLRFIAKTLDGMLNARVSFVYDGTRIFKARTTIDKVIKIINGVHQIQGYNDTQRTNFVAQPTGYQHLLVSKNELGFSDGIADHLPFDGKSSIFMDVNLYDEFSFEFIYFRADNGKNEMFGSDSKAFQFRKFENGRDYFYIGAVGLACFGISKINEYNHYHITCKNNSVTCVINGDKNTKLTSQGNVIMDSSYSMWLGRKSTDNSHAYGLRQKMPFFNFSRRAFTEDEVSTLFKLRQKQYPQLNLGAE